MSLNLKNVFISVFAFCNFFNTINAENKDNHTIISGDTLITKDNRLISSFRNDTSYPVFQDDDFELIGKLRNMPNIEVGKGVTFMPSDKWYKMTIRFRMQNMVGLYFDDDFGLNKTEAQVKRLRLRFDGYIYSPKLTYTIQLGFSPYDAKTLPNENVNAVRDAMVYYVPSSTWNIGFGQTKIKANRARVNSSSALQFVDRSIVNSEFNLDRDFGFFAEYNKVLFADFNIGVKAALTAGDGRNFQGAHKSGFASTARLELFPFGRFKAYGDLFEGDFEREETPKLLLAAAYSFNDRAKRLKGQSGDLIIDSQTRDLNSFFADMIFKYNGFALYGDYMARTCSNPFIYNTDKELSQYIFTGSGINAQTSYIFPSNWEFALRNSILLPEDKVKANVGYDYYNQTTFGVTKYLLGHNLKIQADASFNIKKGMNRAEYNPYEIRFQIELGF